MNAIGHNVYSTFSKFCGAGLSTSFTCNARGGATGVCVFCDESVSLLSVSMDTCSPRLGWSLTAFASSSNLKMEFEY